MCDFLPVEVLRAGASKVMPASAKAMKVLATVLVNGRELRASMKAENWAGVAAAHRKAGEQEGYISWVCSEDLHRCSVHLAM
jgi:hypothetical protein